MPTQCICNRKPAEGICDGRGACPPIAVVPTPPVRLVAKPSGLLGGWCLHDVRTGQSLPGQTRTIIESDSNNNPTITVTFIVDGKDIKFAPVEG